MKTELIEYQEKIDDDNKIMITKYMLDSPIYDSHIDYKWILEGEELKRFKNCIPGQWVFSPNFMNGSIGIFVTPNGNRTDESYERITFGIEFYKIPNRVSQLSADIKFVTNMVDNDGDKIECIRDGVSIYSSTTVHFNKSKHDLTPKKFTNFGKESLMINIIINVVQVVVVGDYVDKSDWHKYGVIDNKQIKKE